MCEPKLNRGKRYINTLFMVMSKGTVILMGKAMERMSHVSGKEVCLPMLLLCRNHCSLTVDFSRPGGCACSSWRVPRYFTYPRNVDKSTYSFSCFGEIDLLYPLQDTTKAFLVFGDITQILEILTFEWFVNDAHWVFFVCLFCLFFFRRLMCV